MQVKAVEYIIEWKINLVAFTSREMFFVNQVLQYLILMTLLIDGDFVFVYVCDELIAFGFP